MRDGLTRYAADARDVLTTYWSIWPAFHLFNFTVTPPEVRVHLIAVVSFVWLIYLSYRSHAEPEPEARTRRPVPPPTESTTLAQPSKKIGDS